MRKIKEIKILEPKIKEIKKEKPKEEILEDEKESLEEFATVNQEEARTNFRKLSLESNEIAEKNLEERVWNVPSEKKHEHKELGPENFYGDGTDLYNNSKNAYSGSGDKSGTGLQEGIILSKKEEGDSLSKYRSVIEERRDSNPLDNSNNGMRKYPRGR
jgi:hypothetical protein